MTLGYAEERRQLLNAGHRELARFPNSEDSNYRSLRNRLASTIQQIRQDILARSQPPSPPLEPGAKSHEPPTAEKQLDEIRRYLKVEQDPEDVLLTHNDTRLESSCSWITTKPSFTQWLETNESRYFWLKGPPGCGKSILASHIVEYLKDSPVCSHFFKAGERETTSISGFLRSMAYQMARVNPEIRESLHQLARRSSPVEIQNHKSIWKDVFMDCVFSEDYPQTYVAFSPTIYKMLTIDAIQSLLGDRRA